MTEQETLQWIHSRKRFSALPGIPRMQRLMALLENPQHQLRCFHVAGTNGKGSTCAMLFSCLREGGYRTGLYISPYIIDFRERMQIDGEMISPEALCRVAERVRPAVEQLEREGDPPVEFEVVTAIAFCWYAEQQCDYVVLEVGLGGRLDATNVISKSVVSVICTIDFDHTELLGDTLTKIAGEKCGIFKENGLAVYSPQTEEAETEIRRIAAERRVSVFRPDPDAFRVFSQDLHGSEAELCGISLSLPLLGSHQLINCATALQALQTARSAGKLELSDEMIRRGIAKVRFPARLELLGENPVRLLDGAHNPNGTRALAAAIRQYFPDKKCVAVMGMLRDKDYASAVEELIPHFASFCTLTPDSPRALPGEELAGTIRRLGGNARSYASAEEAITAAVTEAGADGAMIVCGSLYLAASLRPLLQQAAECE